MADPRNALDIPPEPNAYTAPESGTIVLDDAAWSQLVAALESPPREIPALVELFREKAPWD